jgi:hypothetical protein
MAETKRGVEGLILVSAALDWTGEHRSPTWARLTESVAFFAGSFLSAEAVVFGGEDLIEFFDEYEKFVAVFLYGDEGTEFLYAIAVSFVHREKTGSIKTSREVSVCSMPNNFRACRVYELGAGEAAFCGKRTLRSLFAETFDLDMQGLGQLFEDGAEFGGLGCDHGFRA